MANSEWALSDTKAILMSFSSDIKEQYLKAANEDALPTNRQSEHNSGMTSLPREEFNARLEATEARMDARVASIEGKISNLVIQLEASNSSNVAAIATVTEATKKNEENHRSLKYWLIGTAIAAVVGLYSANIAMVQTMFGAFESGKTTAAAITQATEQMKQTQDQLKAIEERLATHAAPQR